MKMILHTQYAYTHHHHPPHKLKVSKTPDFDQSEDSFLRTSLTMDNCKNVQVKFFLVIFVQPKYNNKNNTILRGFDIIEINLVKKKTC